MFRTVLGFIFIFFFCLFIAWSSSANIRRNEINLLDYGCKRDGKTLNTSLINRAIEEISHAGGGTVYFPPGTYLTGTIYLKDHVTLYLEHGATILGSTDVNDYPENPPLKPGQNALKFGKYSLIYARGVRDFAIVGQGTINGRGNDKVYKKAKMKNPDGSKNDAYYNRPFGLRFIECQNIVIRGICIENTSFWVEDYLDCEDVVVDGIHVESMNWNNDGIDIDGCRNFRLSNSFFHCGDDAICFKSTESEKYCENVTVTNCVVSSRCNGIKFGTISKGGFKNIAVSNCAIDNNRQAALALEAVDGGTMDGVAISNIAMRNVGTAIFIRLGGRSKRSSKDIPGSGIGILKNVSIENIIAYIEDRKDDKTPYSCSITGLPGHPVENVSLSNIKIITQAKYGISDTNIIDDVPEKPSDYPEYSMFGALPAYGFFCRHVDGLTMNNLDLGIEKTDYRSALIFNDVQNLEIHGLKAQSQSGMYPVIECVGVNHALIQGCRALPNTDLFLGVWGDNKDISLLGNDLSKAKTPYVLADNVPGNAIYQSGNRMKSNK